jgi:uncharacterized protein YndB with AHSA1/START domain
MKVIKGILIAILGLVALVLITGLFVDGNMHVEKEVTINKSRTEVFNYIVQLKNQDNYSKWGSMDPNMKKEYKGTDGTVGFVSAWSSENGEVGAGEQEIKKISGMDRIDYELRFLKPFKSVNQAYMTTEEAGPTATKVKWGYSGKMNYPMNVMLLFVDMNELVGKDFYTGLTNLKSLLETGHK